MPHFELRLNEDGSVAEILRDGELYNESVSLEPANQIVSTYFKIGSANLKLMVGQEDDELRRAAGLQSFLMTLTGVEAFTNVFFQRYALEHKNEDLLKRVSEKGALLKKIDDCLGFAFGCSLPNQAELLERVKKLYKLRNQIVHPRWDPASMCLIGEIPISIEGMSQNFQNTFKDAAFCCDAFWQCVEFVAEVGKAAGNSTIEGHCFHWTGVYGLQEEKLAELLGR